MPHQFTFTGIVYIPFTVILAYLAYRYYKLYLTNGRLLYNLLHYTFGIFAFVCLTGALAGTYFSHSASGIRLMIIISAFLLSFGNAVLGYIFILESRIRISPLYGFIPILTLGFIASVITIFTPIHPFVESSGGVNWGMPDYLYQLRVAVYSLGIIPVTVVMFRNFNKTTDSKEKKHYLFLGILFSFFMMIVITDFILEPVLGIEALYSELMILFGSIIGAAVFFTAYEFVISRIEKQFRVMIENTQNLILIIDHDGVIKYANPVFNSLLNYDSGSLLNNSIFNILFTDDRELIRYNLKNAVEQKEGENFEFRFLNRENDILWVESTGPFVPLVQFNKSNDVFLLASHDISARKETEKKLLELTIKAEESERLKTAFLANIYHEVRTPMNAIFGITELLYDESVNKEEKQQYKQLLQANGNRLVKIIDDLIDLSELEANKMVLEPRNCDFKNEILVAIESFTREEKIRTGAVTIITEFPENNMPDYLLTVPQRLQQIFRNLISNAIKFTHKGNINIGFFQDPMKSRHITFYVKDTGIGISPENFSVIFKPFTQVDDRYSRDFEGTGLGLPITKKLVELLTGTIWLKSELNKGSTFFVSFPFTQIPVQTEP